MQTENNSIKYFTPCSEKGLQRILGDILSQKFPLCRPPTLDNQYPPSVQYTEDVRRPLKYLLTQPITTYCHVSFKHGWVIVSSSYLESAHQAMIKYMDSTLNGGIPLTRWRRNPGKIFHVSKTTMNRMEKQKYKQMRIRSKLEELYRNSVAEEKRQSDEETTNSSSDEDSESASAQPPQW